MRVMREHQRIEFHGEDGDTLAVHYDNRGEPYREGITLDLHNGETQQGVSVFLTKREARDLCILLNHITTA